MSKADDLIKAACNLSDALHGAEAGGLELPDSVDMTWSELTIALQALNCNGCKLYMSGHCLGAKELCERYEYA